MKKYHLPLLLCLLLTQPLFSQAGQGDSTDTSAYSYDFYLDHLILWEERLEEDGPLTGVELDEIRNLSSELKSTVFSDLYQEASLLEFLAISKIQRIEEETADPELLNDFLKEAKKEKRQERGRAGKQFWKGFTLGSTILGVAAFNVLLYAGEAAYDDYIAAGDGDEALFYQQRWELMDIGAAGSLGFTALNLLINGVLQLTDLF